MKLILIMFVLIPFSLMANPCDQITAEDYAFVTSCKGNAEAVEESMYAPYTVESVDLCVGKKYIKSTNQIYGSMLWYFYNGEMTIVENGERKIVPFIFNMPDGRVNHRSPIDWTAVEEDASLLNGYSHRSEKKYFNVHHIQFFMTQKKLTIFNEVRKKGFMKKWETLSNIEVNCE